MTGRPRREPKDVAADYDAAAAGYDARHAADPRSARRTALLDRLQLAAIAGADEVLEVGCGTGRLLAQATAARRVGIDVSRGMLHAAAARGLAVARADAHELPFANGRFDGILAGKGVFRYLDPSRSFRECARVLRYGGRLVVHLYGGRTWSPRCRRERSVDGVQGWFEPSRVAQVLVPAAEAGLEAIAIHRFRSIRFRPYLLEIPAWVDREFTAQLWSHVVVVLRRTAADLNAAGRAGHL